MDDNFMKISGKHDGGGKGKNKSIFSRIGRFFSKYMCCGKKSKIPNAKTIDINEFLREDFDNYNRFIVKYDENKLVDHGDGHFYSNNPQKFYLRDFFDIELTVCVPVVGSIVNENELNVDLMCKSIVNDVIDEVLDECIPKKHVSFSFFIEDTEF